MDFDPFQFFCNSIFIYFIFLNDDDDDDLWMLMLMFPLKLLVWSWLWLWEIELQIAFWWEVTREGSSTCIYEEDWGTQVATALPDAIVACRHCCASSSCGFPTIFSDGMADPASYGNHERDFEQVSFSFFLFFSSKLSLSLLSLPFF